LNPVERPALDSFFLLATESKGKGGERDLDRRKFHDASAPKIDPKPYNLI